MIHGLIPISAKEKHLLGALILNEFQLFKLFFLFKLNYLRINFCSWEWGFSLIKNLKCIKIFLTIITSEFTNT
jgi:hypothetical protein